MKRPLVGVVVAYGIGLLLAQWLHPPMIALLLAAGVNVVLIFALKGRRKFLIWPLLALVGWANLTWRASVHSPDDLRVMLGNMEPALATVRGTLVETPRLKILEEKGQETWRSVARVRVGEIRLTENSQPVAGEILVITPGVLGPEFFSGQPVEISGVISRPSTPLAEGLFNFQNYLATRGIYYQLKADSINQWALLEPILSDPPLTDRFLKWSQGTLALGLPGEDEPLRLLWAMTLGWRTAFTGDIGDPFLQAGTMHMFAIDGLRIALLSGMIVTLLRMARISRGWCGVIAVPVIWFYTAATGWESSAIRASVMMTIVLGGWALKRPGDLLNSLAAAALVILLVVDPRQIGEASFQLSFFVMLVIAVMLPVLSAFSEQMIKRWLGPDPLLAEELVPMWRRKLLVYAHRFAQFCGLSFAAWLGSLPLAAEYFHLFSPVSTLANLLAVPLGASALMANLGALICGHWLPWCTVLFNYAAWFLMVAMTWVSVEFARLPGAYFYVPEPSLVTIIIYYGVIVAAFSGWFKTTRRKTIGAVILVLIGTGYFLQWRASRGETDLTVLPLDGGHMIYVDADGRKDDWLINCGSQDAVRFTLKDYLRGQGVNWVPRLVLANGNARNCGGTEEINQLFGIGEIWTSGARFRSSVYREAVGEVAETQRKIFSFGGTNGCWRALFPRAVGGIVKAEDAPLVLLGNFHGTRVLLLSELSREGQNELLAQTNDLRADIVIAGLPDEGEPLCDDLIAAIQPRVIVIVDSDLPVARRASRALHERLERARIPVVYTRKAGAVNIITDETGWRLQTMDGQVFSPAASSEPPKRDAFQK
jgi:competence protein ComEC